MSARVAWVFVANWYKWDRYEFQQIKIALGVNKIVGTHSQKAMLEVEAEPSECAEFAM